jgi:hypothetical protein
MPGGRIEDVPTVREHKLRASQAAKQALADRIAELGAVRPRGAARKKGIGPDTAGKWAKLRLESGESTCVFRGPRGVLCARSDAELDAELELWRCTWVQKGGECCKRYALNASRRCHEHAGCVERGGRLTAEDFAETYDKRGVNLGYLLARLVEKDGGIYLVLDDRGEQLVGIPGERVKRGGRPAAWLLGKQGTLAVLDKHFQCNEDNCSRYALAPTGYCSLHAAGAASHARAQPKARAVCKSCGGLREDFPSQQRDGDLCFDCWMQSDERRHLYRDMLAPAWEAALGEVVKATGLAPKRDVAADLGLAPTGGFIAGLRARGVSTARHTVRGITVVLIDRHAAYQARLDQFRRDDPRLRSWCSPKDVKARLAPRGLLSTPDQQHQAEERLNARKGWFGRLAGETARARGRKVGPERELRVYVIARIHELAADGKPQRRIAEELGIGRGQVYRELHR